MMISVYQLASDRERWCAAMLAYQGWVYEAAPKIAWLVQGKPVGAALAELQGRGAKIVTSWTEPVR